MDRYLDNHVMEGYRFLMDNYRTGDRICIFGKALAIMFQRYLSLLQAFLEGRILLELWQASSTRRDYSLAGTKPKSPSPTSCTSAKTMKASHSVLASSRPTAKTSRLSSSAYGIQSRVWVCSSRERYPSPTPIGLSRLSDMPWHSMNDGPSSSPTTTIVPPIVMLSGRKVYQSLAISRDGSKDRTLMRPPRHRVAIWHSAVSLAEYPRRPTSSRNPLPKKDRVKPWPLTRPSR